MKLPRKIFIILIVLLSSRVIAKKEAKDKDIFVQFKNKLDNTQESLSKKILISTNWIDSFFGNKKSLEEMNGSRIRFFYIVSKTESSDLINTPSYKIDLRLPNIQKRLQLSIENRSNVETQTPTAETELATEQERLNTGTRGSLNLFLQDLSHFKIKLSAGVRFQAPPKVFSNIRISREISLPKKWRIRSISNTFWEQSEGFGQSYSLDTDKDISNNISTRFVNEATWLDSTDILTTSHGPSLYQKLSETRALSYNARLNFSNSHHYRSTEYYFNLVYRQDIHKRWIYYELIPAINFNRENNFHSKLSITAKIECFIGSF